jgi:hypothetical protein
LEETDEVEHEGHELAYRRCAFDRVHESCPASRRCTQANAVVYREGGK